MQVEAKLLQSLAALALDRSGSVQAGQRLRRLPLSGWVTAAWALRPLMQNRVYRQPYCLWQGPRQLQVPVEQDLLPSMAVLVLHY